MKNLIEHAISLLEATVPKLTIGFRLVVYYPPNEDYHLATVSKIEDNKANLLFDTGETVSYLINSNNIIGKGIPTLHNKPFIENGLNEYIKSFYIKPSSKMLQKVKLVTPTVLPKTFKYNNKDDNLNYQKQLDPIYELLVKCSSRMSNSNHNIPYIYRNKLGGEIKKEISIDSLLNKLKKIDKIVIHEPGKNSNCYLISNPYTGKQLVIIPPRVEYEWIVWYIN